MDCPPSAYILEIAINWNQIASWWSLKCGYFWDCLATFVGCDRDLRNLWFLCCCLTCSWFACWNFLSSWGGCSWHTWKTCWLIHYTRKGVDKLLNRYTMKQKSPVCQSSSSQSFSNGTSNVTSKKSVKSSYLVIFTGHSFNHSWNSVYCDIMDKKSSWIFTIKNGIRSRWENRA